MKSIVTMRGVSFELPDGRELFRNLNFTLDSRLTALVGPNGVGKTCLAKLIAKNKAVTYFAQRQEPPAVSVAEYLAQEYSWSLLGESLLAPINRETICTQLSGGEWMRVRLALALNDRFLILDEPTNDLDRDGRGAILQFLRENTSGVLLISHDRECLELCENVLELSNRGLQKYGGGWNSYLKARDLERENSRNKLETAKRERDDNIEERALQNARQQKRNRGGAEKAARGGMPKILIGARKRRAQVTTGKIDASTLERAYESARDAFQAYEELKLNPKMYADIVGKEIPAQKLIAEARNFNVKFGKWLYPKDLNFVWRGNLRLAIKGSNGSGKSTLLRSILGTEFSSRGELRRGKLATLYLDQKCSSLNDELSILENVRQTSSKDESEIRNALAQFLFVKDSVFQLAGTLSGGERMRAALAKGLLNTEAPEILILDEPTNNLDLTNIQFLENLVSEFRGALIAISHDEVFLTNCGVRNELKLIGADDR